MTIMQTWRDASPTPTESAEQQHLFEWARYMEAIDMITRYLAGGE